MKIPIILLTLICSAGMVTAQKISSGDIKKIVLATTESTVGSNLGIVLEVIYRHGKWNSYQTQRNYFNADAGAPPIGIDTTRKLIAVLTRHQVDKFLTSIAITKPFNDKTFNISSEKILTDIRKKIKLTSKANLDKLPGLIYKESIQRAIKGVLKDVSVFDWSKSCSIDVIKNNGDTLQLYTQHLYVTMLPWTVNNVDSYDVNINNFFLAAMGNQIYPNRETLNIGNLEDRLYDYLGGNHVAGTLKLLTPGN